MPTSDKQSAGSTGPDPIRLRPAVIIVALQWFAWLGLPVVAPGPVAGYASLTGAILGGLAIVIWWLFLSRAPRAERWGPPPF